MKLLEDLGLEYPRPTSKLKTHYGLYECPKCLTGFKTRMTDVKAGRIKGCRKCGKKTHGESRGKSSLYNRWLVMKDRCINPNNKSYHRYGGRGINIDKEFIESYENYKNYVENLYGYDLNLSIDRIDNNKGYIKGNLRWATVNTQTQNTRKIYSHNTTGYRGVNRCGDKFRGAINVNGKKIQLGTFVDAKECAKAYDNYVISNNLEHTINGVLDASAK